VSARASICAIGAALFLCGCAAQSGATRDGVQIERDRFSSTVIVVGPAASLEPYGGTFRQWFLKSRLDTKSRAVATRLYVDITYVGGWRRYGTAADRTASKLTIEKIASQVDVCFGAGVCSRQEIVGIELDGRKLRSCVLDGYTIRIGAKTADGFAVTVSPAQIHAQLATLAKLGALPAAAPHGARLGEAC
jgi:hypothetical protein